MTKWINVLATASATAALAASGGALAQAANVFNGAVDRGDARTVQQMLKQGVEPNTVDERGDHALLVAARAGAMPVVKALVEGKAKIELRTRHGDTAIMAASFNGHLPVVKFLRESGASINYKGWTPLLYAAHNGHTEIVKYLLEQGADPTTSAPNGVTALMIAAREGHVDAVNALIDYGVDLNQKNELGEDAVFWANRAELPEMVKLLKAAIAKSK
jgi:uncharacterized protein